MRCRFRPERSQQKQVWMERQGLFRRTATAVRAYRDLVVASHPPATCAGARMGA